MSIADDSRTSPCSQIFSFALGFDVSGPGIALARVKEIGPKQYAAQATPAEATSPTTYCYTPLVEEDGTFVGVVSLAQDITERKKTEEALEASRRRFQAVFEYSLDGILLMDDEGRYVDGNPAICELLGCSHDALVKMSVWDVTPLPDRERIPELLDAFRSAGTLSGEYTLLCKGGATRDVEYRSVANIQPGLHLGVHRDITDRKRSAAALRESEERFRFLAESIPHMVWAVSPDGNVDYYNRRLLEYLGVTTEQVQGQRWAETVHPDDRRRRPRGLGACLPHRGRVSHRIPPPQREDRGIPLVHRARPSPTRPRGQGRLLVRYLHRYR